MKPSFRITTLLNFLITLTTITAFTLLPHSPLNFKTATSSFSSSSSLCQTTPPPSSSTKTCLNAICPGTRRVVVTGYGITSCLGNTIPEVTKSLYDCTSGITKSDEYETLGLKSHVRGVPKLTNDDFKELIPKGSLRFMGTNAKYAYVAMTRAIEHANLPSSIYSNNPRVCAILGQGGTSIPDITATADAVKEGGRWKNKVGPFRVTRSMGSAVSAVLATAFKIQGTSYSISSACSSGSHCIGSGMEQIILNKSDVCFVGSGEAERMEFTAMFDCMGALSTASNGNPTKASRAFDKKRDGFVIAGGGGVLILEELEHAKKRGAKIYAELVGYGSNSDGYDMVAPSGLGGQRCMKLAVEMADNIGGVKNVDYINAHGTSTPVGDVTELTGIKAVFDEYGYQPFVGSTKSLSGHSLGAAGVHEAIYTLIMMDNDFLAESANIEELVEEAERMNILTERREGKVGRAMSNSFGFGGTNCALVFDKWVEE